MPGAHHVIEPEFMDGIPNKARGASWNILNRMPFDKLLEIYFGEKECTGLKSAGFNQEEIKDIARKIALAKLVYFEINTIYQKEHIDYLIELVLILHGNEENVGDIAKGYEVSHVIFFKWLVKLLKRKFFFDRQRNTVTGI